MGLIGIFISALVINNYVLSKFLGICGFLGVSNKFDSALSMGLAVTFVMAMTALVTWPISNLILIPLGLDQFLTYLVYIIVIAALVQFVEMFIRKASQPLYQALGIYLPLITTNCAILGFAIFALQERMNFLQTLVYSVASGLGFTLAIALLAGIREQLETADIPMPFRGAGISLMVAGILALAFMGFAGITF